MSRLDVEFLERGFHRVLFDAMPIPVFVVDKDVSILDYNSAAAQFVGLDKRSNIGRRGGDLLHCLNSTRDIKGCGYSTLCRDCVVRNSVRSAFEGRSVTRKRTKMKVSAEGKNVPIDLRVSCKPFTYERRAYALLILEGLTA
jgi:PAS domain-containing protein